MGKITGWNYKDPINGYAGNGKPIDAIEIYYTTPDSIRSTGTVYRAQYKVSPLDAETFYDWQYDTETTNGQDGYAGSFGVAIDKIYVNLD